MIFLPRGEISGTCGHFPFLLLYLVSAALERDMLLIGAGAGIWY